MSLWLEHTLSYWRAGGMLLAAIALVSVGLWTVLLHSRGMFVSALQQLGDIQRKLQEHRSGAKCSGGINAWDGRGSLIAADIARALNEVDSSRTAAILDRTGEREVGRLGRHIVMLAAFTAVAPLLGLLGTVIGMIETFASVSAASGEAMEGIAGGISRALITTQCGLVVAIPGVFGSVRLRRLKRELETCFETIRIVAVMIVERAKNSETH